MPLPKLPFLAVCTYSFAVAVSLAADAPVLKDSAEQKAWAAITARFISPPTVKTDSPKTTEVAVTGLKNDPKGDKATASIIIDKASGRVSAVVSNGAGISDAEMASFGAFSELSNITLWHNSGNGFTGTGLAGVAKLPKLDRLTLAGGSFDDAGMAEAAKMPKLRELRAWHSKFTDAGIAAFRNHPTIESITIGPMWEKALTDKTLESLSTCPKLKKFGIAETWLTWEGGLKHLTKLKGTLTDLDLGNCIIEPAEVERLKAEMPGTKIAWKGIGAGKEELSKAWIRPKAEKWIPKELLDRVMAEK